jgi:hypothetical protein
MNKITAAVARINAASHITTEVVADAAILNDSKAQGVTAAAIVQACKVANVKADTTRVSDYRRLSRASNLIGLTKRAAVMEVTRPHLARADLDKTEAVSRAAVAHLLGARASVGAVMTLRKEKAGQEAITAALVALEAEAAAAMAEAEGDPKVAARKMAGKRSK